MLRRILIVVVAMALGLVVAPSAQADEDTTYQFTGTIAGTDGSAMDVALFDADPTSGAAAVRTDRVDTEFDFSELAAGTYWIRLTDSRGRYVPLTQQLAIGQDSTSATFTVQRAYGTVKGSLTAPRTTKFSECTVRLAEQGTDSFELVPVRPGGRWSTTVPTGTYVGSVECATWIGGDLPPFDVTIGATTTVAPFAVTDGAGYTGVVLHEPLVGATRKLRGIRVIALDGVIQVSEAYTGDDGRFTIKGLRPGRSYQLDFIDENDEYRGTSISPEPLTSADEVVDVSADLPPLSTMGGVDGVQLRGTVTGGARRLAGVLVTAASIDGNTSQVIRTHQDGSYTFAGLPDGKYLLSYMYFDDVLKQQWEFQYYPGGQSPARATTVTVDGDAVVDLLDVSLRRLGTVRGVVGAPDPGDTDLLGKVYAVDADGSVVAEAEVQPDGTYSIGGLAAGTYRLRIVLSRYDSDSEYEFIPVTTAVFAVVNGADAVRNVSLSRTLQATATPRVTGSAVPGGSLVAQPGVWSSMAETEFSYQWLSNGAPIAGATTATYVVPRSASQLGRAISVRVTAANRRDRYLPGTAASAVTATVRTASTVTTKASSRSRAVSVAVTVKAPYTTPTGKVVLRKGSKTVATATLKGGKATLKATRQKKGKATYAVTYVGSNSVSARTTQVKIKVR